MLTGLEHSELLTENLSTTAACPPDAVLQELSHLAMTHDTLPYLTAELFERLRKISGQSLASEYFGGVQYLAAQGNPAGARLLAAFLNVSTPGERLLPVVQPLNSSRRYMARLSDPDVGLGPFQTDWLKRQARAETAAAHLGQVWGLKMPPAGTKGPEHQHPWPLMRQVFAKLLEQAMEEEFWEQEGAPKLLAEMLRLEVDAWQERISHLAGNINPYRVDSVMRILPLLNRADAEIRDLRLMTTWIAERDFESAFITPLPRWRETLDDKDWNHLLRDLGTSENLGGLACLAVGLSARPILVSQLAEGIRRIMAVSLALVGEGVRDEGLNLFTACVLAQSHYGNGQIVFAVEKEMEETLEKILPDSPGPDHPLIGVSVMAGLLIIELGENLPQLADGLSSTRDFTEAEDVALRTWREQHSEVDTSDLAALRELDLALARKLNGEEDEDDEEVEDLGATGLKNLVMTNIQSVSVLLGFLRNPKITSIPGLVEEIVVRTRNPQIIATIANDRVLHTGFANKGVALACLRSPVNVSVKTLRKFCHVKYVAKIELKRMAADRTGIRKEVGREIKKYLDALA